MDQLVLKPMACLYRGRLSYAAEGPCASQLDTEWIELESALEGLQAASSALASESARQAAATATLIGQLASRRHGVQDATEQGG